MSSRTLVPIIAASLSAYTTLCSSTSSAAGLILPIVEGGDGWLNTPLRNDQRTMQIVYSSSLLADLLPGSFITGLAFRLDGGEPSWPATDRTWASYDVQLSKSLNAPGFLSPTFDLNIGSDATTVRSGPLTIAGLSYVGNSSPNPFGPEISFLTPYTYNGGDLLITIRHTGNGIDSPRLDRQTSVLGLHQAQYASSYTAAEVGTDPINTPILRLSHAPVPEPSTYALLLMTGAGALWWARRR